MNFLMIEILKNDMEVFYTNIMSGFKNIEGKFDIVMNNPVLQNDLQLSYSLMYLQMKGSQKNSKNT